MRFTKMHGLGNDYVYIDAVTDPSLEHLDWPLLAPEISDRHTGVGGDGVILICPPTSPENHARMRTFNADGSESGACGNGTRCVARFVRERLGRHDDLLLIESGSRVLECEPLDGGLVQVAMGRPGLLPEDCEIDPFHLASASPMAIELDGNLLQFTPVSMGNPHAVAFTNDNSWIGKDLASEARRLGPRIESHAAFTKRVNAHLVHVDARSHAVVHTWERGAGPTRACGTGACATLVAGVLAGLLDHAATLTLPGGDLHVSWNPAADGGNDIVRQCGPAEFVFDGLMTHSLERTAV